jgi:hypothetical protein
VETLEQNIYLNRAPTYYTQGRTSSNNTTDKLCTPRQYTDHDDIIQRYGRRLYEIRLPVSIDSKIWIIWWYVFDGKEVKQLLRFVWRPLRDFPGIESSLPGQDVICPIADVRLTFRVLGYTGYQVAFSSPGNISLNSGFLKAYAR